MDRTIYQSQSQVRSFDLQGDEHSTLYALAGAVQDILGGTTTVLTGFAATPTSPASLTINLASGRIYQEAPADATSDGAIVQDLTNIYQQGFAVAQSITLSTSGITSGQSRYSLIEAQFSQVDSIRVGDPTGGLLLFYNAANPSQPYEGPGNDGLTSNTIRQGLVTIQVITGASATTGSEVPPSPTSGWVPLYLVDLAYGQTTITSGEILTAGPSVGTNVPSNYQQAPFLAGLLNQHHLGITGYAPKIDLTAEVKNTLPLTNLPASSNTSGTGIPVLKLYAGNPNGNVAGNANVNSTSDLCWDTSDKILYICTTTGSSSSAVWSTVTGGNNIFTGGTTTGTSAAQVLASTVPTTGFSLSNNGQVLAFTAGYAPSAGGTTLQITSPAIAATAIEKPGVSGLVPLTGTEWAAGETVFIAVNTTAGCYQLLDSPPLGAIAYLNVGAGLTSSGGNLVNNNLRTTLTGNKTYYVATTGSDSNPGTSGSPWLTLQHAWNYIINNIDQAGYTVTIQTGDGTYNAGINGNSSTTGPIIINGDTGNPTNVLVTQASGNAFFIQGGGYSTTLQNFIVETTTSGNSLEAGNSAVVNVGTGMFFGQCPGIAIAASDRASIYLTNSFTFYQTIGQGLVADTCGGIKVSSAITISLISTPTFTIFADAQDCGVIYGLQNVTFSGSATGQRYNVNSNAVINTNGSGSTFLPGNTSGATATGGQYI